MTRPPRWAKWIHRTRLRWRRWWDRNDITGLLVESSQRLWIVLLLSLILYGPFLLLIYHLIGGD